MKKAFFILPTRKRFIVCIALSLLMSLIAYTQTSDTVGERNKEVIRKYQERINRGDTKGAVEYISDEMMNFGRVVGKKGIELVLNDVFATFPDWRAETLEMVAIGDAVILRQKVTATHLGTGKYGVNGGLLVGVKPTGKRFEVTHMHWYMLRDGKIVGHYGNRDDLGMMQQLGLVPTSLTSRDSTIVR